MTDLESRLKEAFESRAAAVRPSPDAAADNRHRVRRATRRRHAALACAAAATVAAVTVPMAVSAHLPISRITSGTTSGALVKKKGDPADLTKKSVPVEVPASPAGPMVPVALSPDGSFLARFGSELWQIGAPLTRGQPRPGKSTRLYSLERAFPSAKNPQPNSRYAITPQARIYAFQDGMSCANAAGEVKAGYGPIDTRYGVWADGTHVVYTEQPWAIRAYRLCGHASPKDAETLATSDMLARAHAFPVALSDPTLFYLDSTKLTTLNEIDLSTTPPRFARSLPVPRAMLPAKTSDIGRTWVAAATKQTLAWVNGRTLYLKDRMNGSSDAPVSVDHLPTMSGTSQLTVGNDVIAYSVTDSRGRVGSFVYDLRTHERVVWPGRVFAAGDWLLWQDGRTAKLAKVR
ncbi:hypothetical protein [Actinomadura gamaensis]|uniref:Uncharacterized protein n=1 Tax=Actinomadura gamaensis TaxID=1763541 RepID=A0ABV9TX19_9ACTN